MTPNQQAQKDRAREESERHLSYAAVDRMRDKQLANYEREDAISNRQTGTTARKVLDANNAYAGEE
jgi:hypothetical protein